MDDLILRCALQNAVKYEGTASLQSVLGLVFSFKEFKDADRKELVEHVKRVIVRVNKLSLEEQEKKLVLFGEIKKKKTKETFPELEHVNGKVTVRFAPNPNGALTLGHCRVALWNWFFRQRYGGCYILRFDDTSPLVKAPLKEAYQWIKDDLLWLDVAPDKIIIESKRFPIYYAYAEKLIALGGAYVDTLPAKEMREDLWEGKISDERNDSLSDVMKKWKKMFTSYSDGEAVLRIKTDITHPNPAVRDWVAFRIVRKGKHPLVNVRVWPMLNFASAIDDHDFNVTHILRGSDLEVSDVRQQYIYDYFKWTYPTTKYNGKLLVSGIKSTTESFQLIQEGALTGWDDPRLGTITALRRRGFQKDAIIKFITDAGIGKNDMNVNIGVLEAENKNIIDSTSNRYFLVVEPRKVAIKNNLHTTIDIPLHPTFPQRGMRRFSVSDEFYVDEVFEPGKNYRFMHLFNFRNLAFVSEPLDPHLKAKMIHWLPAEKGLIPVEVIMSDHTRITGLGENGLRKVKIGEIVQFERKFFARCDQKLKGKMIFYYTHT